MMKTLIPHRLAMLACATLPLLACGTATTTPATTDDVAGAADVAQTEDTAAVAIDPLALRPLSVSADRKIVDDQNAQVLLRGVNVTSLGEYWQGDPTLAPTQELTAADWSEMAARGFNVIRLVVHWSKLEPTRGTLDAAYVQRIDDYVTTAAKHGIYTVIDMHQDAYSAFIFTTLASECTDTTHPAKGWDGAPKWATLTDGLSTCITGDRNSSPAVTAAWNHFYDNTDGIQDRFVATWGALAAHFAGRVEVAGYDILNEPEVSRPSAQLAPLYNQLVKNTVLAIRKAEEGAPFGHLIIVEPAFAAGHPSYGLALPDPAAVGLDVKNLVAGPHNYAEAIENGLGLTIEDMSNVYEGAANTMGVPMWVGEHGFWSVSPDTLEKLTRFAADEDARAIGGAWWQWRQPCGDPHSVPWGGYAATGQTNEQIHLHGLACPSQKDLGPTLPLLTVVGRAFPRVAPGRIQKLASDAATGKFTLEATQATPGAPVVVWVPAMVGKYEVKTTNLADVQLQEVTGGRYVTGVVAAGHTDYAVGVGVVP